MSKKRDRRILDVEAREEARTGANKTRFDLRELTPVRPITPTQEDLFRAFPERNLMLTGLAGTGKTFLAAYLALRLVLEPGNEYDRLVILRSVVPTRDVGFLPGDLEEKTAVYEDPYAGICDELFPYAKSYENLKRGGYVQFSPTSFLRGVTLDRCVVLVDESQNNTFHELDSITTRLGPNARIIFSGDTAQSDLGPNSGLPQFLSLTCRLTDHFACIDFHRPEDIVRSGVVRAYLEEKAQWVM